MPIITILYAFWNKNGVKLLGVRKAQYLFEDQRAGGPIYVHYIKLARNRLGFGYFRRLNLAKILAISIN